MYANEADAVNGMNLLEGSGWQALAACEPEKGVLGIHIFRNEPTNLPGFDPGHWPTEVTCEFEWPMFDRPLVPAAKTVDVAALLEFVKDEPEVYECNDPTRFLYGFVSYRLASEGVALIRRCRVMDIRKMSKDDQEAIKRKVPSTNPAANRVVALAVAIQGALEAKAKGTPQTREEWAKALEDALAGAQRTVDLSEIRPEGSTVSDADVAALVALDEAVRNEAAAAEGTDKPA